MTTSTLSTLDTFKKKLNKQASFFKYVKVPVYLLAMAMAAFGILNRADIDSYLLFFLLPFYAIMACLLCTNTKWEAKNQTLGALAISFNMSLFTYAPCLAALTIHLFTLSATLENLNDFKKFALKHYDDAPEGSDEAKMLALQTQFKEQDGQFEKHSNKISGPIAVAIVGSIGWLLYHGGPMFTI